MSQCVNAIFAIAINFQGSSSHLCNQCVDQYYRRDRIRAEEEKVIMTNRGHYCYAN
jgi:hypothetical protein